MNTIVIYGPYVVAAIGGAVYALAGNAKAAELGRLAFLAGLVAGLVTHVHC